MSLKKVRIGDFLKRSKIPVDIEDSKEYKRVTIRINHNGVSMRDVEIGKQIGTKKQFILRSGQFVMSKIDARYGAFGIAPEEVEGAIITGNFWAYNVDTDMVNIEWFNQFTNSPDFYDLCERASSGITHRKYLNESFFLNHEIDLPSPNEQLEVIERIKVQKRSFSSISTELTHQLTLVQKLRQQLLQEAVQGKLVPQDPGDEPASILLQKIKAEKERLVKEKKIKKDKDLPEIKAEEIPFEIPEGWVWCRLSEVCDAIVDCPHSTPKYVDNDTGYFGIDTNCINEKGEITRLRSLSIAEYTDRIRRLTPKANDIVYSREGTIGLAAFIPDDKNICLGQRVMLFRPSIVVTPAYLRYLVTEEKYKARLLSKHRGMGAKHINVGDITGSLIPLPPLAEQNRIVQKLEQLLQVCDNLQASIQESRVYNEQLLQQVLREALKGA